jgi:diguanylate cyclase (GGDEF)-like protein
VRTSRRPHADATTERRRSGDGGSIDVDGAALVVTVDQLGRIAELHGEPAVTEVLRTAGQRIRQTLRRDDLSVQWGGEDLVVVLRDVSIDVAVEVGQRIRIAVSQPLTFLDGRSIVPTCSVGCAAGDADRVDELVDRARLALELARSSGGNCVRRALAVEDRWTAGVAAGF